MGGRRGGSKTAKSQARQMGWAADRGACRGAGAVSRSGAHRLADPGQSQLDRGRAGHHHLPCRQRRPRRHHHAHRRARPGLAAADPGARFRERGSGRRLHRVRGGRAASLSQHADLVGHHPAHDLGRADRRRPGDARRICPKPLLCGAHRSGSGPRNIAGLWAAVRADFDARRQRPAGARSTIPATARPTPFTGRPARPARFAPATAGRRGSCGWPASRRACGRRSRQGLVWRYRRYNGLGLLEAAARIPVKAARRT